MRSWKGPLEELLRDRRGSLVGYAYLLTGDRPQAEDLVHDAIVRTFTRARRLDNVYQAEGYVKRTISSQFINGARSAATARAKQHLLEPQPVPSHESAVVDAVAVEEALRHLGPRERACIVMRYYDDQSVTEIAQALGVADGTVKRYLHDATHRLESILGPVPDLHHDDPTVPVTPRSTS